jgi:hypothetical protein
MYADITNVALVFPQKKIAPQLGRIAELIDYSNSFGGEGKVFISEKLHFLNNTRLFFLLIPGMRAIL